jgi:hypothetical protein
MAGGWRPSIEHALDPARDRQRSVDLRLDRYDGRETAVVEIWDWFDDVGAAWRGLDAKAASVRRDHAARELMGSSPWRVSALIVVRATRRNRALVREFGALFRAKFPTSGREWVGALRSKYVPMPDAAGFVWTDVRGTRLFEARP